MDRFITKEVIRKGWSEDRKYCVTDADGQRYLLRVSDLSLAERKKAEQQAMERLSGLGIPMCDPVAFGTDNEGVWSLQRWIDGADAEERIPQLPEDEQYHYGLDAGRILTVIHSLPAPEGREDWGLRFNRKIDRKQKQYLSCPLRYEHDQGFLSCIEENRHLLQGRPQCFQHGDYHIGNMMIDGDGVLTVIDFNRWDYGDPFEEFSRIVWCAQCSPLFASGMVDGYFDGQVPMEFWRLLALYMSVNALSSLPWAIPFEEKEIQVMLRNAQQMNEWYDGMTRVVPRWYCGR